MTSDAGVPENADDHAKGAASGGAMERPAWGRRPAGEGAGAGRRGSRSGSGGQGFDGRRGGRGSGDRGRGAFTGGDRGRDDRGGRSGSTRGGRADRPESLAGGARALAPKEGRKPEPAIPAGVSGQSLGQVVWDELKTLSKDNMKGVAAHIESAYLFMGEDLDAALAHAETASRRAGRVPSAREVLGTVHYARGEWADALRELRTATRLSGSPHLLPLIADCQRGLGRPEKALELGESREASRLEPEALVEMAIVLSGAHRDLGDLRSAAAMLETPAERLRAGDPGAGRLWFAYGEVLEELGRPEARTWHDRAAAAGETGVDSLEALEEGLYYDLEDFAPAASTPEPAAQEPGPQESAPQGPGATEVGTDAAEVGTQESQAPAASGEVVEPAESGESGDEVSSGDEASSTNEETAPRGAEG